MNGRAIRQTASRNTLHKQPNWFFIAACGCYLPGEKVSKRTSENTEQLLQEQTAANDEQSVVEQGPIADFLRSDATVLVNNPLIDSLEARHQSWTQRMRQNPQRVTMIAGAILLILIGTLIRVDTPQCFASAKL
ncbi:MAG: hypothetical protein R2911_02475 [Caldilineaceae bacterium]